MFGKKSNRKYLSLKETWEKRGKDLQDNLWAKHGESLHFLFDNAKQFAFGSLAGITLLASSGNVSLSVPIVSAHTRHSNQEDLDKSISLVLDLSSKLPTEVRPFLPFEEKGITEALSTRLGAPVASELQGIRLNTNYGYIGQEQHLYRYPGDSLQDHFENVEDELVYKDFGVAPGLGAWGYFAPSKDTFTNKDKLREKYYIAVQTFLSPGFDENVGQYSTFFKYRKMLIVNSQNGRAMVVDIADSGPSPWTGKQFGGSPAVMHYLERVDGSQKGPVLIFFIDDPEDRIPLGPIEI